MSLYAMSDLHLSLSVDKSMEVFDGWENYVNRIRENWLEIITDDDTVVLPGDISWGMNFLQAKDDFAFINSLPGQKVIMKGNHDYWWTTKSKMENFFAQYGFSTLHILNNNHYNYENYGICGTRGWINENGQPADKKVLVREAGRLEASICSALKDNKKPLVFLHYPPVFVNDYNYDILEVLTKYNIEKCFYGHIHGKSSSYAVKGVVDGIEYHLISSDYLQFKPLKVI